MPATSPSVSTSAMSYEPTGRGPEVADPDPSVVSVATRVSVPAWRTAKTKPDSSGFVGLSGASPVDDWISFWILMMPSGSTGRCWPGS